MNTVPAIVPCEGSWFPAVNSVVFDGDGELFTIAHDRGFRCYHTTPLALGYCKEDQGDEQGLAVRLIAFNGDLVAFVGMRSPKGSFDEKVIVFNSAQQQQLCFLELLEPVYNILLIPQFIVVVLLLKIMVYECGETPRLHASYDTARNEDGIAAVAPLILGHVLAFPARLSGQVQIVDLAVLDAGHRSTVRIVKAHKASLQCVSLSHRGTLMATASLAGTLIRVHCCVTGMLFHEFRRGADHAIISSMEFSPEDSRLAVLSDKGTLHVFNLDQLGQGPSNRRHVLLVPRLKFAVPAYFHSTWLCCSVNTAKYQELGHSQSQETGTLAWTDPDHVVIVWHHKHLYEQYTILENANSNWVIERTSWQVLRWRRA